MESHPTKLTLGADGVARAYLLAERLPNGLPMRHAILVSLLAACGTAPGGTGTDDPWGPDLGTPENPVPAESGPYAVANKVDFTVEQILPEQIEAVVATLRSFSDNPARSLIELAERAGVPAATTIYDLIPSPLRGKFEGFINDEVAKAKVNGMPITDYAGRFAMIFEYALTDFEVTSTMTLEPGRQVDHTLTGVDLRPAGVDLVVPISGLAGDVLTQHPTISVAEGGFVTFSEQHFGLNYGEYAWQAIDGFSQRQFGGDIKTVISNAVNCPGLAKTISDKCVLGVCIGHETEIRNVCTGGVGAIVDFLKAEVTAQRIEGLHFKSGATRMVDDNGDGVGDRLVDGEWDAEMNFGLGLRHTNATFEGARAAE